MIAVMRLRKFEFEPVMGFEAVYKGPEVGFLPVFATREDAKREYPNGPFVEIAALEGKDGSE